jgi:polyisoprenoid-binding protein YceI
LFQRATQAQTQQGVPVFQITPVTSKITFYPYTFDVPGTFTLRGISKAESLTLTVNKADERSGKIDGTLAIDRRDFGMNGNIPFVKIGDRVDVNIALDAKRVSGPALLK